MRRIASLLLAVIVGSARCAEPTEDQPPSSAHRPNVRGADISVVTDFGQHDPSPVVRPAVPLHLVMDDCRDFVLFNVPDTNSDPQNGILVLNWSEPADRQRSLTILANSPSCAAHQGVKRLLEIGLR
jgi:hypothetical protein